MSEEPQPMDDETKEAAADLMKALGDLAAAVAEDMPDLEPEDDE